MFKWIRAALHKYRELPKNVKIAVIPSLLTITGLAMLFLSKYDVSVLFWISVSLYTLTIFFKIIVDYDNVNLMEKKNNEIENLRECINNLNKCVEIKTTRMVRAYRGGKNVVEIAGRAKGRMNFRYSSETLSNGLHQSLVTYLNRAKRLNGGNVIVSLLKPNSDGVFQIIGTPARTLGGTRLPVPDTSINIADKNTAAGYVWGNMISSRVSYSSTALAEKDKLFKYTHPDQGTAFGQFFASS